MWVCFQKITFPRWIKSVSVQVWRFLHYFVISFCLNADPYFIPTTTANKKIFALAKESGRKAARYIVQKHPDLFKKPKPDPEIPAFLAATQLPYQRPENVSVNDLVACMRKGSLTAAYEVYADLKEKQPDMLTPEVRQELLERLCHSNSEDDVDSDLMEEQWFAQYIQKEARPRWKLGGIAEKVFHDVQPKTPAAYAVMISAMAKFMYVEGASVLLEEMQQQNLPIPVQVNGLLLFLLIRFLILNPKNFQDWLWESLCLGVRFHQKYEK